MHVKIGYLGQNEVACANLYELMHAKHGNLCQIEVACTHLYELVDICMQELEIKARMVSHAHTCMYL